MSLSIPPGPISSSESASGEASRRRRFDADLDFCWDLSGLGGLLSGLEGRFRLVPGRAKKGSDMLTSGEKTFGLKKGENRRSITCHCPWRSHFQGARLAFYVAILAGNNKEEREDDLMGYTGNFLE